MTLAAVMKSLEGVPEAVAELYTQKGDVFELTGITGVKTQADIDRLTTSLTKERDEHKATKTALGQWGELKHDEVNAKLDRFDELEAAATGKLDDDKIEEIVGKRLEGTLKSKLSPLERQVATLTKERDEAVDLATKRGGILTTNSIHGAMRKAMTDKGVIPGAQEDALLYAPQFEVREDDGAVVTKEGGLTVADWIADLELGGKKSHWFGETTGGGAGGSGGKGGVSNGSDNPWSAAGWNMTKQGQLLKEHGRERANALAKAAGTTVGGPRPKPKK